MGPDDKNIIISDAARVHHLRDVLRLKAGDAAFAFNEICGEYESTVTRIDKSTISLEKKVKTQDARVSAPIHVYFCPLKRQATEWLVEKATELGVTHFHPVISHHTLVREPNIDRLRAIATEATEQCGRIDVPQFDAPAPLTQIHNEGPMFVAAERSHGTAPLFSTAVRVRANIRSVLIGPEGGFSAEEMSWLAGRPTFTLTSFGSNTLRAETAAIFACSLFRAGLDENE